METQTSATNVSFLNTEDDMAEEPVGSLASSTTQSADSYYDWVNITSSASKDEYQL